jgi:hypothetical protein
MPNFKDVDADILQTFENIREVCDSRLDCDNVTEDESSILNYILELIDDVLEDEPTDV